MSVYELGRDIFCGPLMPVLRYYLYKNYLFIIIYIQKHIIQIKKESLQISVLPEEKGFPERKV